MITAGVTVLFDLEKVSKAYPGRAVFRQWSGRIAIYKHPKIIKGTCHIRQHFRQPYTCETRR